MPEPSPAKPRTLVIRVDRISYLGVALFLVATIILAGASMAYLGWTLVLPVLLALWIARLRSEFTALGLRGVTTFASRDASWDQVQGLQFGRWSTKAVLGGGDTITLPAVTIRHLTAISEISNGRIRDPYQAAPEQAPG